MSGKLAGSSHGPRLPAPCPYGHGARPHVVITIPAWFPVKGKQDARKTPAGAKPPPPPKRGDQSTGNEDTAASDSAESGGKNKKKISGGGKEKGFIVYRVVMCVDGVQRSIEQRYRLFEELHRDLEKAYPDAVIPALPGKVFNLDKNDRKVRVTMLRSFRSMRWRMRMHLQFYVSPVSFGSNPSRDMQCIMHRQWSCDVCNWRSSYRIWLHPISVVPLSSYTGWALW